MVLMWHASRLPVKYVHVYHNLPARPNDWMVADNLADCFRALGKVDEKDYGEIAGVNMKFLIGDLATVIFRRATQACSRITRLAQSAASARQVEGSPELGYFVRDLITLRAILDSRKAYIPRDVLLEYVQLSENIVAYIRGNPEAEALHRKIRAITAPRPARRPVAQAPVTTLVETKVTQADIDESVKHDD